VLEHHLGRREIGDHSILHGSDHSDAAWGATQHALGGVADGLNDLLALCPTLLSNRDDRRFVENYSLAAHVDKRVRGTEINGNILRIKERKKAQFRTF